MPGGGRHGCNPYVKISTTYQSIIKIIDGSESLYKTNGKENATIIFQEVTNMLLDITAPIIPFKGFQVHPCAAAFRNEGKSYPEGQIQDHPLPFLL